MRTYEHFNPNRYPDYRFEQDGTPVRRSPTTRGQSANREDFQPRSTTRKRDGREVFHLRRDDGQYRPVSRALILATLFPDQLPPPQPRDPGRLPPRHYPIPGFDDYAVQLYPPRVVRYHNDNLGPIDPPAEIQISERTRRTATRDYLYVGYRLIDHETGRPTFVTWDRILRLCGFAAADVAAEQTRVLAARAPQLTTVAPLPTPAAP